MLIRFVPSSRTVYSSSRFRVAPRIFLPHPAPRPGALVFGAPRPGRPGAPANPARQGPRASGAGTGLGDGNLNRQNCAAGPTGSESDTRDQDPELGDQAQGRAGPGARRRLWRAEPGRAGATGRWRCGQGHVAALSMATPRGADGIPHRFAATFYKGSDRDVAGWRESWSNHGQVMVKPWSLFRWDSDTVPRHDSPIAPLHDYPLWMMLYLFSDCLFHYFKSGDSQTVQGGVLSVVMCDSPL
jgi:hypothetical protein